jgi:hypothetical protein
MTDITTPPAAKLPNGNSAIRLPSGELVDPAYLSASNMTRQGPQEFDAVLAWILSERDRRAEQAAAREAEMAERADAIRAEVETRHKAQKAYAEKFPWKVA